jgi:hypothetical protein
MSLEDAIRREILWHLAEASKHRGAQNDAADAGDCETATDRKYDAIGHETAAERLRAILETCGE